MIVCCGFCTLVLGLHLLSIFATMHFWWREQFEKGCPQSLWDDISLPHTGPQGAPVSCRVNHTCKIESHIVTDAWHYCSEISSLKFRHSLR